jgi:hypothetical protein
VDIIVINLAKMRLASPIGGRATAGIRSANFSSIRLLLAFKTERYKVVVKITMITIRRKQPLVCEDGYFRKAQITYYASDFNRSVYPVASFFTDKEMR